MNIEGYWARSDIRRAFVEGAKWWEFISTGATMWQSDRNRAEKEASKRYPDTKLLNYEKSMDLFESLVDKGAKDGPGFASVTKLKENEYEILLKIGV